MIRAFKYQCLMTESAEKKLIRWLDLCRELYNAALQERIDCYQRNIKGRVTPLERPYVFAENPRALKPGKEPKPAIVHHGMTLTEQQARLPQIKRDRPEYATMPSQVLKDILQRLDKTYKAFFRGGGFPKFKGRKHYNSIVFPNSSGWQIVSAAETGHMKLWVEHLGNVELQSNRERKTKPRYGAILKLHGGRLLPKAAEVRTVTICREGPDKWWVIFSCDGIPMEPLPEINRTIAIAEGVNRFLTDSDGNIVDNPRFFQNAVKELRVINRKLSRQKDGSKAKERTYKRRRELYRKIKNQREDFHCKTALHYAREYDRIIVGNLSIKKMIEDGKMKRGLSTRIADVAWGFFHQRVENVCEKHFRDFQKDDPAFRSRTCNHCGSVYSRPVTEMVYRCLNPDCGAELDRPLNSALNMEDIADGTFKPGEVPLGGR